MSPSRSTTIVCPSGETSSDIQVPSSVVNSTFVSAFKGSPSSFFSSFLSSWLLFSCASGEPARKTTDRIQSARSRSEHLMFGPPVIDDSHISDPHAFFQAHCFTTETTEDTERRSPNERK